MFYFESVTGKLQHKLKHGLLSTPKYVSRWPANPKVAFFGPPNVFMDEMSKRFCIDLGIPILQADQMFADYATMYEEGSEAHQKPFFEAVHRMVKEGDKQELCHEKILLKLLRLEPSYNHGFALSDYPRNINEAILMEEYRGGLNAFVHISLPDEILFDIEHTKHKCTGCDKVYYQDDVISEEHGIRIDKFMPENGTCDDCGGKEFVSGSDAKTFDAQLEQYNTMKDDLLSFYSRHATLVDF